MCAQAAGSSWLCAAACPAWLHTGGRHWCRAASSHTPERSPCMNRKQCPAFYLTLLLKLLLHHFWESIIKKCCGWSFLFTVVGPVFMNMCIHPGRAWLSWRDWRFWLSAYAVLKKWWTVRGLLWLSSNTSVPLCKINLSWRIKKLGWGLSSSETMGIQVGLGVPQVKLLHCILYGLMALLSILVGSYYIQQKITLAW